MNMKRTSIAMLVAAVGLGAGGGIAAYATLGQGQAEAKAQRTVIRQVTVPSSQPAAESALSVTGIYRRAYRGVVQITVTENAPSPFGGSGSQAQAQGSGFVYDAKGDIVTNDHVVNGATGISVRFWNGKSYSAHVVGSDASTDLAVVKVDAPASMLHPLSLGDSNALSVGDGVVAIGSPFGLAETVTSGIVSALHRQLSSPNGYAINDSIQTDAAINHGNSGGPLLDDAGDVVGVTAQIKSESGGNEGVGFAIPSDTVKAVAGQILATGKVEHAYLGVRLDSSTLGSARVAAVQPGTPAARAGLRSGDVVTAVAGTKVDSAVGLENAIGARKPGERVSLTYRRGGTTHTVQVTLATRPSQAVH
jgi:putative serine protease PepD